jgi:hypothetical protein
MGQIQTFNPETIPTEQYSPEKGRFIAEAYADGSSVKEICECSGGWLPSMLIVRRWRSMYPAFDALMAEAAACRAENYVEDIVKIADDDSRQASHNRNSITAREKLAGWMAPRLYGQGGRQEEAARGDAVPVYALTDDQLLIIAAGKVAPALEGECERVSEGGHPPQGGDGYGIRYEEPDPPPPEIKSGGHSVTTNGLRITKTNGSVPFVEINNPEDYSVTTVERGRSFIGMDDEEI